MKTLYSLSSCLIVLLSVAAFNPSTVVDAYDVARIRVIEIPRAVDALEERQRGAETGRMVDLYHVGMYHISSSEYTWPGYYPDVLGEKNRMRGMNMLHRAAGAGHPEALFLVSEFEEAGEEYLMAAIERGSHQAIGQLYLHLLEQPCDTSVSRYVDVVRRRMGDDDYPWIHPQAPTEHHEQRTAWKSELGRDLDVIDAFIRTDCASG